MIYLDHNATSPLDPGALDRMLPFLTQEHGNASSLHGPGQRARQAIDEAREQIAGTLGCMPKELIFTSGGTEANNLALRGVFAARRQAARRVVISCVEHPSVLDTARALSSEGADLLELGVGADGQLSNEELDRAITPGTALVSVMWANNETGVVSPIEQIGRICRERGVTFHVDAVQAAGKVPIDLHQASIDLLSISAHKVYGPKGIGALFVRKGTPLWTVQTGGHQERGRRGGTENVAAIVGFGHALAVSAQRLNDENIRLSRLRDELAQALRDKIPEVMIVGEESPRLSNTLNVCFRGIEGEALLMALDLAGICASSGSACTSGSLEPSHVLKAMGIADEWSRGAVRFSLGRHTTDEEIAQVSATLPELVARLR